MQVDKRTRFSRMAAHCLEALYDDLLAGIPHLNASDRFDIENAALAEARLRMLQEAEMRGAAGAADVTAAWHIARKCKRVVERIARRKGRRR